MLSTAIGATGICGLLAMPLIVWTTLSTPGPAIRHTTQAEPPPRHIVDPPPSQLDTDAIELLQALGYVIEPDSPPRAMPDPEPSIPRPTRLSTFHLPMSEPYNIIELRCSDERFRSRLLDGTAQFYDITSGPCLVTFKGSGPRQMLDIMVTEHTEWTCRSTPDGMQCRPRAESPRLVDRRDTAEDRAPAPPAAQTQEPAPATAPEPVEPLAPPRTPQRAPSTLLADLEAAESPQAKVRLQLDAVDDQLVEFDRINAELDAAINELRRQKGLPPREVNVAGSTPGGDSGGIDSEKRTGNGGG